MEHPRPSARITARIAYLDVMIPSLEKQLEDLRKEREASLAYLPYADALPSEPKRSSEPRPLMTPKRKARRPLDPATNVGRAMQLLAAHPNGVTANELIALSAQTGKPFLRQSITSQLSQMVKRNMIIKIGERYVAVT